MSSPGAMSRGGQWPTQQPQGPPMNSNNDGNEDGVSIRPMRLKVLYTFDDQNKTNCLARGEDVLQIKTVAMDETTSIGILDLKTCIQTVIRCSPELLSRVGGDYTVYAYDYSEYDNPLVGQGMLSRVLAAASPAPDAPAHQSQKLITGRVCKNILGLFNNGVKETLEVKLRLVPVPTTMQNEYVNTMEKYREMSSSVPPGFDHNEWTKFLQSNPNMSQMANNFGAPASTASNHRGSMNMEVVNQLLSPSIQQQVPQDPFNQIPNTDSGNESRGGTNASKTKKTSRPSSRAAVKRPRAKRQPKAAANAGGNTSGYEEGTDGDDGPAPRKRAKITQTDWNSKSSFGPGSDSLRVAASTAGSLRMFRPIAMSPVPTTAGHLQELPRAPTPVPNLPNQHVARDREPTESGLRRESSGAVEQLPTRKHVSPYPRLDPPEDQLRDSIESANPSPERYSPAESPLDIGSSPPVMRTASRMRSSPPCPSSPVLPEMPRIEQDSGFMSGTLLDDLFGEDYDEALDPDYTEDAPPYISRRDELRQLKADEDNGPKVFTIEEEIPGPMELLPTKMPVFEPAQPKATTLSVPKPAPKPPRSRGGSVVSEDGQSLPLLKRGRGRVSTRLSTPSRPDTEVQPSLNAPQEVTNQPLQATRDPTPPQPIAQQPAIQAAPTPSTSEPSANTSSSKSQSRSGSRTLVRTASMGSLSFPAIPASDPVLPPSTLQRSQTWTETPLPATEALMATQPAPPTQLQLPPAFPDYKEAVPYSRTLNAKKASIRQKLETAIAKGEMPPFCSNCGAIETPTWRKAWSQEHTGAPGYYEYSDLPGKVTTIVILARDSEGNPTLYQLVKKYLGKDEDQNEWKEFILCNPCGIWMSKYKSHRPEERWESNNPNPDRRGSIPKPPGAKRPSQRGSRAKKNQSMGNMNLTSDANFPPSDVWYPPSEANYPQSDAPGPAEVLKPLDIASIAQYDLQVQRVELPTDQSQPSRPAKRLNAMTSDAASAALRRAIQSSPARWTGTQQSPVDLEDELGSTRRLLFPSPRKDGSPKVLRDVQTNIVQNSPCLRSPKEDAQSVEAQNKENCPPAVGAEDADAELLALFEAEMARPKTPVQNGMAPNPFKTPTRPTPTHRPITRSVSKSIRSGKSPAQALLFSQRTPSRTPGSAARRRSPRHHNAAFESPFTATMNQLISEANNPSSPSRHCDIGIDFDNLPDLPLMDNTMHHGNHNVNFNLEDFFSTDVPMPSSPPRLFHLYEDPAVMANVDWSEFDQFDGHLLNSSRQENGEEVQVKSEPADEDFMGQSTEHQTHPTALDMTGQLLETRAQLPSTTSSQSSETLVSSHAKSLEENLTQSPSDETPEEAAEEPAQQPIEEDEDEVDMVGVEDTS